MFKLKRPCQNCPFHKGQGERYQLLPGRIYEITRAPAFQCHKTIDYEEYDDPVLKQGDKPQQCAGLMAVLHRAQIPNQIMQVAERFGKLDPATLDPDCEAYESLEEVYEAHVR